MIKESPLEIRIYNLEFQMQKSERWIRISPCDSLAKFITWIILEKYRGIMHLYLIAITGQLFSVLLAIHDGFFILLHVYSALTVHILLQPHQYRFDWNCLVLKITDSAAFGYQELSEVVLIWSNLFLTFFSGNSIWKVLKDEQ